MSRYDKTFTVRPTDDNRLEVFQGGKILYRLAADTWRQQLQEWRNTGWDIIWSA